MSEEKAEPAWMADLRSVEGRCCSGFFFDAAALIAPSSGAGSSRYVLTAAHFLREIRGAGAKVRVAYDGTWQWCDSWRLIPRTDLAVLRLPRAAAFDELPRLGSRVLWPGTRFTAGGFGATSTLRWRAGVFLFPMPWVASRGLSTRVTHGGYVAAWPRAIPGDSGGPVLVRGEVSAMQSMIFDPLGFNAGIAVVARIRPYLQAIRAAVLELASSASGNGEAAP